MDFCAGFQRALLKIDGRRDDLRTASRHNMHMKRKRANAPMQVRLFLIRKIASKQSLRRIPDHGQKEARTNGMDKKQIKKGNGCDR